MPRLRVEARGRLVEEDQLGPPDDRHGEREAQHVMRSVGYVPQEAGVPGTARVKDLLSYAAWLKGVPSRESVESIGAVLAELSIAELAQRKTGSLSGGERQRVSIAMALVHRLTVLILDEPTAGLDPVQRVLLRRTIDELAQQRAIVVSTHLVEDMGGHGDTVLVLHEGRIAFTGTPDELRAIARPEDVGVSTLERGSIGRTGRAQSGAHA